jgi:hypothetical protein
MAAKASINLLTFQLTQKETLPFETSDFSELLSQ